uniref:chromogranin-A-like n=1 Tax=Lonchura striata TaxID=40157 RepID=UPI000B4CB87C|nr:chromogranin-A-like [Lonchura striata domestica]
MSGCAFPGCSSPASALGLTGSVSGGREAAAEGPRGRRQQRRRAEREQQQQEEEEEEEKEETEDRQAAEMSRRNVPQR